MPSTGFIDGPFSLDHVTIQRVVTRVSPGAYALGYTNDKGSFVVSYVGRSDDNLASRLSNWVGQYDQFKAGYFDSPKQAFEKECKMFHDFGGTKSLDNKIHPARPANSGWKCPSGLQCF